KTRPPRGPPPRPPRPQGPWPKNGLFSKPQPAGKAPFHIPRPIQPPPHPKPLIVVPLGRSVSDISRYIVIYRLRYITICRCQCPIRFSEMSENAAPAPSNVE